VTDYLRWAATRMATGNLRGQFWLFQLAGWSGLSIISYFSLNLWYDQPDLAYVGHNILQSALGMAVSWPLRSIFRAVWTYGPALRLAIITASVLLFATVWAALRLALFEWMTEESGLWPDFGGWLFPSIFIFLCWTALYHVFKYSRLAELEHSALLNMSSERNQQAAKAARAESTAREAQLTMLRYQLNPHFLFNTLNAIQSLVMSRQTDRATEMIASLSDFLRYSLYTDSKKLVTVEDEIDAMRLYLLIEQARFGSRLVVNINVADAAATELMPSMLLQPLVENSIKYAVAKSEQGGSIDIDAYCDGTHLNLEVSDSGHGALDLPSMGDTGVGLKNIRQRLASTYGPDHDFSLQTLASGGVRAHIRIPLLYNSAAIA
jgi:signal transduction histidine kinase